jgi:threonine dehydrogenase-like Zn-dependent dehydrogenase
MKAVTFAGYREVVYESVPDPAIETDGDVIVRVELAGLCGSDLHPYHLREEGLDAGTVMGHEFVGEIVETGSAVTGLSKGQRVFSPFTTSCGHCSYCRSGLTSRCPEGQLFGWVGGGEGLHGGQAEYVRVPLASSTLLPIPEGVSPEQALLLGDIYSTGFFCAEMAGVQPGGVYAVVGCGPVGILAILAAQQLGAEMIYALDGVPERLELAQEVNAVPIDIRREDAVQVLHEANDGRGADAVLEAVGSFEAERAAIELVRPGGTIAVVGVHNDETLAFSPTEAYDKNLTYRVGRCPARAYMERLAPQIRERDPGITRVISHRLPLSDAEEAYRLFDEKRDGCTKVVMTP